MIVEKHYDQEVLISLLESAERDREIVGDPHLESCAECRTSLHSLRELTEVLKDEAIWSRYEPSDEVPPKVMAHLSGFATRMATEDAEAEVRVRELLSGPRETWADHLAANPQWQTAGMVRKLIEATDRAIQLHPPDALEITSLGRKLAEQLSSALPNESIRLQAACWREQAYALYIMGDFAAALAALDRTDQQLSTLPVAEYDSARSMLVRALVLRELERYSEATRLVDESARIFACFGDRRRLAYAKMTEAMIHNSNRNFLAAIQALSAADSELAELSDLPARAGVLQNIATCYRELGQFQQAGDYFQRAIPLFEALEMHASLIRARWHVGRLYIAQGRFEPALGVLQHVRSEFQRLEMLHEADLVALDEAECQSVLGNRSAVVELCQTLIASLQQAGLSYTTDALTALAYLREASGTGALTHELVVNIRGYFEELPPRRELVLAFPAPLA